MAVALIQLVSEQTMQNVVPALALRPAQLFHLSTPRTAPRSGHILEAIRQASLPLVATVHELSAMPSIEEAAAATTAAIRTARDGGHVPVVNFTGGTKLMSIGAYDAARIEGVTSLYVDTDRERLIDGGTGERLETVLGDDLTFRPIEKSLTVNVIAVANGSERVTGGVPWESYAPLARHLLAHRGDEDRCWTATRGKGGILSPAGEPQKWKDWIVLSEQPLSLPPLAGQLAEDGKLVRKIGAHWCLPGPDAEQLVKLADRDEALRLEQRSRRRGSRPGSEIESDIQSNRQKLVKLIEPTQRSLNILSGGWLEIALADAASQSRRFRDLRWSVLTGGRGWGEEQEQDLLGVRGVQIALFSCKRGGLKAKLRSELEIIQSRARFLGGVFTHRFLCVAKPPLSRTLRRQAAELGIGLITVDMLRDGTAFTTP